MSGMKLESVQYDKDLGVTIASNLKFSYHCKEAACKANRMLGFINRIFPSGIKSDPKWIMRCNFGRLTMQRI